jgi:cell filamentation protein
MNYSKDPYTYEDGTLINKLNIRDYNELRQAEADIGFLKLINIDSLEYDKLNEELLCRIHYHILSDIFDWAGQYRKTPIFKGELVIPGLSLRYADVKNIGKELKKQMTELNKIEWNLDDLDEVAYLFARKIAVMWKIHPFRDGNTRTFLSFAYIFAKAKGFPFDMELFANELNRKYDDNGKVTNYSVRDRFVLASLDDDHYPEVGPLAYLFKAAMASYKEKNSGMNK